MSKITNRNIPLGQLELAPDNVRRTPADAAADEQLRASILALDVLENLLVRPKKGVRNTFQVVAGGRRLAALQALAANGDIPGDHPVPCRLLDGAATDTDVSLHENEVRAAMHPADRFEAYHALTKQGLTSSVIATRFGVSERSVERLLRLASVAPELVTAYRDGAMTLETLMAFSVTEDHAAQKEIWDRSQAQHRALWPNEVRRELTEGAVAGNAALARFVGIDAYERAGGMVQRDLFSEDSDGVYLTDRALVNRLAGEKLQAAANDLATEWKWAEARIEPDYDAVNRMVRLKMIPVPPTEEEQAQLDALRKKLADFDDAGQLSDEQVEEYYRVEAEANALEEELDEKGTYREEDKAIAGCVVYVDPNGGTAVIGGLVRPEDVPKQEEPPAPEPEAAESHPPAAGDTNGSTTAATADTGEATAADSVNDDAVGPPAPSFGERFEDPVWSSGRTKAANPAVKAAEEAGMSLSLTNDLKSIRTGVVKARLARNFTVAFDLFLFELVEKLHTLGRDNCTSITGTETHMRPVDRLREDDFAIANPGEKLFVRPKLDIAAEDRLARFDALRNLDRRTKQRLFAGCVAAFLNDQIAFEPRAKPELERVIELLDIDFAGQVRPTEQYFWRRLKREQLLKVGRQVLGDAWADARLRAKKATLAEELGGIFGSKPAARGGFDAEVRERIEAWTMPGFKPWDHDSGLVDNGPSDAAAPAEQPDEAPGAKNETDAGAAETVVDFPEPAPDAQAPVAEADELPAFMHEESA